MKLREYKVYVYCLGKFSLEKKKKVWTFTLLVQTPPPLKSVKLNKIFFSHTLTETYFGKRNLFFHLKT